MNLWPKWVLRRLRFKMVAAALCGVIVVSLVGWIGLSYTNQVANIITRTTDTHIPLLANAVSASNAMRRLTRAARGILQACDLADGSHHAWFDGAIGKEFAAIDTLADFLQQMNSHDLANKVHSAKEELQLTINNLSTLCDTRETLQNKFEARRLQALALVAEIDQLVQSMNWIEKSALHLAHLSAYLAQQRLNLKHAHSNQVLKGTSTQKGQLRVLADMNHEINALIAEFGDLDQTDARVSQIKTLLLSLTENLSGPGGLHDIWRRVRLFDSGTAAQKMMVSRAEISMAAVLQGLEDDARVQYQQATQTIDARIVESRWVIGLVSTAASVLLLILGLLIASRLTRPMERLTAHVEHLRSTDDLSQTTPTNLLSRVDEIGALAQSFDQLIRELANARLRLLKESQENIRIQYDRLTAAIESIPQGLSLTGSDGRLLMCNSQFLKLYNLAPHQVREGMPLRKLLELLRQQGARWLNQPGNASLINLDDLSRAPQMLDFCNNKTIVVRVADTPEGGLVSVHEDITERRRQEEQITQLAHHDTLTGLVNRTLFHEQLHTSMNDLQQGQELVLLCLGLDNFKSVNDSLGHPIGDRLLIMVSERLRHCLQDTDQVARLGGDEFGILRTSDTSLKPVTQLALNVIEHLSQPYIINHQTIVIGVSIGIAISPRDSADPDILLKRADIALFRAKKEEGRNSYRYFESEMDINIQARRTLELDLREAIENEELEVFYQPQIGFESQTVEGFEALLRWNHRERGYVSPAEFIPLAEEIGLINRVGQWVLQRACQDALQWPDAISIAVNLSPLQFLNETLLDMVRQCLETTGLNPQRLELEITEGVLLEDTNHTLTILQNLKNLGVQFAMDDFGTGYSSLSYLRKFHFDKVKIDRSFVSGMEESSDNQAVVKAICGLCKSLDIGTIAEGVETDLQLAILQQTSCTQWQGYYYSRAVPLPETLEFFATEACDEQTINSPA
jgi:diguanylate cyclase (GGDEF)-like protein